MRFNQMECSIRLVAGEEAMLFFASKSDSFVRGTYIERGQ